MASDTRAAKFNLERYRKCRAMARNEIDVDRRAKLRIIARQFLRQAAQADAIFVARESAEAAASLLEKTTQRTAKLIAMELRGAHVVRPDIRVWKQGPRSKRMVTTVDIGATNKGGTSLDD